jgi:AP-1-like factor
MASCLRRAAATRRSRAPKAGERSKTEPRTPLLVLLLADRCSQRAFRARKERHVKDLEKKLSEIESSATTLASDNQRLKLAMQRLMTENEILRSSSGRPARMGKKPAQGPRKDGKALGEKASDVLSMSDAWDFLIEHTLVKEGFVDITDASYRLRRAAKPGPHGPVFHKGEAQAAIQGSRKGGGDVLA